MFVNDKTGLSYNFKSLDDDSKNLTVSRVVKFPAIQTIVSASAATINLVALHARTIVKQAVGAAMTINIDVTKCEIGDELTIYLVNDGTQRVVTFGTGFNASGTVTGTVDKTIVVRFQFDGTKFIEVTRSAAITIA